MFFFLPQRKEQEKNGVQEVKERAQRDTVMKMGLMAILDMIETERQRLEVKTVKVEEKLICEKAKSKFNLTLWNGMKQMKARAHIKWKHRREDMRMVETLKELEEQLVLCGLQKLEEESSRERLWQQEKNDLLRDKDKLIATLLKRETYKIEAEKNLESTINDLQGKIGKLNRMSKNNKVEKHGKDSGTDKR